jgi:hypothetical protein
LSRENLDIVVTFLFYSLLITYILYHIIQILSIPYLDAHAIDLDDKRLSPSKGKGREILSPFV